MQSNHIREYSESQEQAVQEGVCVLSGFGVKVVVDGQHLRCSDGFADERRELRLSRATCGLKRLVIVGHTGFVSLDALRWLSKIGAGISAVDADGSILMASSPIGADYPNLRRAQAVARDSPIGLDVVRTLLDAKIVGQAELLGTLTDDPPSLRDHQQRLTTALDYDNLRWIEGQAASIYWSHWSDVPVVFTRQDRQRVPSHWLSFDCRTSPITGGPRKASNPANALLNYLYTMLETETVIACQTFGLDPGIGMMHSDQPSRNSLALDIMEAVRPQVDRWLLQFLSRQTFRKHDFCEEESSGCTRLAYEIRKMLAETSPQWARLIGPWVEYVTRTLNGHSKQRIPTPLSQSNRARGRDAVRRNPKHETKLTVRAQPVCRSCGTPLQDWSRTYCDDCSPGRREEQLKLLSAGPETLRRARAMGSDPAHGGEAARRRSDTQRRHAVERQQWSADKDLKEMRARFASETQPRLASAPLSAIMNATGLSIRYAALIKSGARVPHPMHYEALERVATDCDQPGERDDHVA